MISPVRKLPFFSFPNSTEQSILSKQTRFFSKRTRREEIDHRLRCTAQILKNVLGLGSWSLVRKKTTNIINPQQNPQVGWIRLGAPVSSSLFVLQCFDVLFYQREPHVQSLGWDCRFKPVLSLALEGTLHRCSWR